MTTDRTKGVERSRLQVQGFDDPEMEYQLLRGLSAANYGGAALGELLVAAKLTRKLTAAQPDAEQDPAQCWADAHSRLGQQVEAQGRAALQKGHRVSARDHLFRASMYYRAAEFYCDPYTEAHRRWGMASRDTFILGAMQLDAPPQVVHIPYENVDIPAYFFQPNPPAKGPRKTLIVNTGFDGSGEELYFMTGRAALERGYNVLLIDGPGQTGMTRLHPELKFRPDWEIPMKAVVDWLAGVDAVDMNRLGLYGISLGGYFTTRATCFEPRIRALAVNSPIVDLKAYELGFFPPDVVNDPPEVRLEWMADIPRSEMPDKLRALLKIAFFRFGVDSLRDWVNLLDAFQTGEHLARIRIPCLSMVGAAEGGEPLAQARAFHNGVNGPVTERVFRYEEGADAHCQAGNLPLSVAVLFDWMDEVFA
ncbi:MAG: CocE/NonD family hydrolase [Burkholderiaceae bacterium]